MFAELVSLAVIVFFHGGFLGLKGFAWAEVAGADDDAETIWCTGSLWCTASVTSDPVRV